ncbi:MAG: UvrD-helicase domain-containing protein [Actinomycetota bacterium]
MGDGAHVAEVAADEAARRAIAAELDATLFVEAGPGTGKTSSLVDRVIALVDAGLPMGAVAAITFTEKAAAELRDRIRRELERNAAGNPLRAAAVDEIDGAAVGTLHAFAQRLLLTHPVEAGLPPRLEVHDEITSQVAFQTRWEEFLDGLLHDPTHERVVLLALAAGVTLEHLREIALAFDANWDLVEEWVDRDPPEPPAVDANELIETLTRLCDAADHCRDPDDRMLARLQTYAAYLEELRQADEDELLGLLRDDSIRFATKLGQQGNWPAGMLQNVRAEVANADRIRSRICSETIEACLHRLAGVIAEFTLESAERRRLEGRLEFHDLLVRARALLRGPHGPVVRESLRARFQRLLLDEFQDTDPIQIEIAALLASPDPGVGGQAWSAITVDDGRLFFVGDPKQSIYRFRRADIALFLRARTAYCDEPVHLTRNFRTAAPILEWLNHTFARLIRPIDGSQPAYVPLLATKPAAPLGPHVVLLGAVPHADNPKADPLREREASEVIGAVRAAIRDGWAVRSDDGWRPAQLGDICILLPARTSLAALERALDAAAIPYRADASSLVYATREVRDLLATARAIDDPTDELSLVTALRSPLFGCGDDDLYRFRIVHRGRWSAVSRLPESLPDDDPVGEALRYLRRLHDQRHWLAPSELLARIVAERRMLELAVVGNRTRDVWRRLRFVVDQARAYTEAQGGGLRDYLAWADLQASETSRVAEAILPETDDDAVRIMTVHAAKGLEFPITIVSGMTTAPRSRRGGVQVVFPPDGGFGLRLTTTITTEAFDAFGPIDEQMDFHEKLRLLYVACTRARDHLVISTHRVARDPSPDETRRTSAELLWEAGGDGPHVTLGPLSDQAGSRETSSEQLPPLPDRDTWWAERTAVLDAGRRAPSVSATRLARHVEARAAGEPGLAKGPRDLDLPPWRKGRYGSAVGRAVHAVLQTIDLRTGAGLEPAAAAQAVAEGVLGMEDTIRALAASALHVPCVREAAEREFWRETYVAIPVGDALLEGYVDLLYRTDDGLVVVDYKTDGTGPPGRGDPRAASYRLQGAAYAAAVALATEQEVRRCVFVFLGLRRAREWETEDLDAAIRDVLAAVPRVTAP